MSLLVCCEVLLRLSVEVYHGFCQWISAVSKRRQSFEHCSVKSAVDLLERLGAWEIDKDEWSVSKESV